MKPVDARELGARIRELRRRKHLTQAQLAEQVGIRAGPMNYLENGHHLPSLPVMVKLASNLGVTVDQLVAAGSAPAYIVRESGQPYVACGESPPWMVESTDGLAQAAQMILFAPHKQSLPEAGRQMLEDIMRAYLALEDMCCVQKQATIPLDMRVPGREALLPRFVEKLRHLLGVSQAVIFDYIELLENAGLRVIFFPLPADIQSIACYDRTHRNVFLFVHAGATVEHQLFRLCYELGRVCLYNGTAGLGRVGKLDPEHAARRFAALFLMPEDAVLSTVQQVGVQPHQWNWDMLMRIKHRFGVSAETFLYRLQELKLVTAPRKKQLQTEIYAFYEKYQYAEPDSSRRTLTPNGRLGDLLLAARITMPKSSELRDIHKTLKALKVKMP